MQTYIEHKHKENNTVSGIADTKECLKLLAFGICMTLVEMYVTGLYLAFRLSTERPQINEASPYH